MAVNVAVGLSITAGVTGDQSVDKLNDKLKKLAATADISAGQIKQAYRQLPAQFTDIAVSLAGGQSPFMVLLQQGGQIKDQFGSIGTALRALGSFITPVAAGVAGLAAILGGLGTAMYAASEEARDFAKVLALTGGAAGVTYGAMGEAAKKLAESTNISTASAKEMLNGLIAAGVSGAAGLAPMSEAMVQIQKLSGAATEDIVKDFASMSRGVATWAADRNKQLNFLTAAQYEQIRTLEKQGELDKAMLLTNELINKAMNSRTVEVNLFVEAWKEVTKVASEAWTAVKKFYAADTNQSLLDEAEAELAALEAKLAQRKRGIYQRGGISTNEEEIASAKREVVRRRAAVKLENDTSAEDAKRAADERAKIEKIASGRAEAELGASLKQRVQLNQNATDKIIAGFTRQSMELERLHASEMITDADYYNQKATLEGKVLEAKVGLINQEIAIEQQRKVFGAEEIDKQTRILALIGRRAELMTQIQNMPLKAGIDIAKDETRDRKKAETEAATAAKALATRKQTERDTIEKMRIERSAEIEQLRLEGQAINMSAHEFEVLTAARQAEMEIARATVAMLPQNASAYRAVAEAADRTAAAIRQANYEQSRTFGFGAKEAFNEYVESVGDVAQSSKQLFTDAFKGMEDALVSFAMTGKLSFRSLANSIIQDMIRIVIQQSIMGPIMGALGGMFSGGFGGAAAGTQFSGSASISNFAANGMAFDGVDAFADGGVVNSPTMFKFANGGELRTGLMGEAGPEAILPLQRGANGRLGVVSTGGNSGGDTSVVVNVNVESGGEKVTSNQGASALGKIIAGAVRTELINQKRPGGMLAA